MSFEALMNIGSGLSASIFFFVPQKKDFRFYPCYAEREDMAEQLVQVFYFFCNNTKVWSNRIVY
jgi:hypothetical protein